MVAIQYLSLALSLALFVLKIFALVDCVARNPRTFELDSQVPKTGWLVILGLGLVAHIVRANPLSLLNLLGTVAALVYLAQMRGSHRSF